MASLRTSMSEWLRIIDDAFVQREYCALQPRPAPQSKVSCDHSSDERAGTRLNPKSHGSQAAPSSQDGTRPRAEAPSPLEMRRVVLKEMLRDYAIKSKVLEREPEPKPRAQRKKRRGGGSRRQHIGGGFRFGFNVDGDLLLSSSSLEPRRQASGGGAASPKPYTFQSSCLCTYTESGKNFIMQRWYSCKTCGLTGNSGCCEVCLLRCHVGHDVMLRKTSAFYCDCGAERKECCALLPPEPRPVKRPAVSGEKVAPSGLVQALAESLGGDNTTAMDLPPERLAREAAGKLSAEKLKAFCAQVVAASGASRLDDPTREPVHAYRGLVSGFAAYLNDAAIRPAEEQSSGDIKMSGRSTWPVRTSRVALALTTLAVATRIPECLMVAARTLLGLHSARPGAAFTADDDVQNNRHPACDALGQLANHLSELDVPVLRPHAELFRWTETFQVDHASARANAIAVGPNGRFIYSHSSAGLRKIGTGAGDTERGRVYCRDPSFYPNQRIYLCCVQGKLYVRGTGISWPMVEVVRCEDLTRLDPIRLGDDLSWRRGYHIDPMVSDGRYIYLIRVDKQSKSASRGSASPRKRRFLSVHVYDPSVRGDNLVSNDDPLKLKAAQVAARMGHRYTERDCVVALRRCDMDPNRASAWLLDHGDALSAAPSPARVRSIVLDHEIKRSEDAAILRCAIRKAAAMCTGRYLTMYIPAMTSSGRNPTPGRFALRVWCMKTGQRSAEDVVDLKIESARCCYDPSQSQIWTSMVVADGGGGGGASRASNDASRTRLGLTFASCRNFGSRGAHIPLSTTATAMSGPLRLASWLLSQAARVANHVLADARSPVRVEINPAADAFDTWIQRRREARREETQYRERERLIKSRRAGESGGGSGDLDDISLLLQQPGARIEARCTSAPNREGRLSSRGWPRSFRGTIIGVNSSQSSSGPGSSGGSGSGLTTTYDCKFDNGDRVRDVRREEILSLISARGELLRISDEAKLRPAQRDQIAMLEAMGFSRFAGLHALSQTGWAIERAVGFLTSQPQAVAIAEQQQLLAQHAIRQEAQRVRKVGTLDRGPVIAAARRATEAATRLRNVLGNLGIAMPPGLDVQLPPSAAGGAKTTAGGDDEKSSSAGLIAASGPDPSARECGVQRLGTSPYCLQADPPTLWSFAELAKAAVDAARAAPKDQKSTLLALARNSLELLRGGIKHAVGGMKITGDRPVLGKRLVDTLTGLLLVESSDGDKAAVGGAFRDLSMSAATCLLDGMPLHTDTPADRVGVVAKLLHGVEGAADASRAALRWLANEQNRTVVLRDGGSYVAESDRSKTSDSTTGASVSDPLLHLFLGGGPETYAQRVRSVITLVDAEWTRPAAGDSGVAAAGLHLLVALARELALKSDVFAILKPPNNEAAESSAARATAALAQFVCIVVASSERLLKTFTARVVAAASTKDTGPDPAGVLAELDRAAAASSLSLLPSVLALWSCTRVPKTPPTVAIPSIADAFAAAAQLNKAVAALRSGSGSGGGGVAQVDSLKSSSSSSSSQPAPEYTVESDHPYGCGRRIFKRHVHIPGAVGIALAFDQRCCTEGPEDSVHLFVDPAAREPLSLGPYYGNALDANSHWPKRCVVVPGNSVTLCLDAQSKPIMSKDMQYQRDDDEKARWGVRIVAKGVFARRLTWYEAAEEALADAVAARAKAATIFSAPIASETQSQDEMPSLDAQLDRFYRQAGLPLLSRGLLRGAVTSDASRFLRDFVQGNTKAQALIDLIQTEPCISRDAAVALYLKRMAPETRRRWHTAIRATIGCMLHHSGIADDVRAWAKGEGGSGSTALATTPSQRGETERRVRAVLQNAAKTQRAMLRHVQALRLWAALADQPPAESKGLWDEIGHDAWKVEVICAYEGVWFCRRAGGMRRSVNALFDKLVEARSAAADVDYIGPSQGSTQSPELRVCKRIYSIAKQLLEFAPFVAGGGSGPDGADGGALSSDEEELNDLDLNRIMSVPVRKKKPSRRPRAAAVQPMPSSLLPPRKSAPGFGTAVDVDGGSDDDGTPLELNRVKSARFTSGSQGARPQASQRSGAATRRLGAFRTWVDNYNKWKAWSSQGALGGADNKTSGRGDGASMPVPTPFDAIHRVLSRGSAMTANALASAATAHNTRASARKDALTRVTALLSTAQCCASMGIAVSAATRLLRTPAGASCAVLEGIQACAETARAAIMVAVRRCASGLLAAVRSGRASGPVRDQALITLLSLPPLRPADKSVFAETQMAAFEVALSALDRRSTGKPSPPPHARQFAASEGKRKEIKAKKHATDECDKVEPLDYEPGPLWPALLSRAQSLLPKAGTSRAKSSRRGAAAMAQAREHAVRAMLGFLITLTARVVSSEPTPPSNHAMLDGTLRWACAAVGAAGRAAVQDAAACAMAIVMTQATAQMPSPRTIRLASRLARVTWPLVAPARLTARARALFPRAGAAMGELGPTQALICFLGSLVCPIDMEKSGGFAGGPGGTARSPESHCVVMHASAEDRGGKNDLDEEDFYEILSGVKTPRELQMDPARIGQFISTARTNGGKSDCKRRTAAYENRSRYRMSTSQRLFVFHGACSTSGLDLTGRSGPARVAACTARAECCVRGGKWYFEVEVLTNCSDLRIGWCLRSFSPRPGQPAGSDRRSWTYNPATGTADHAGERRAFCKALRRPGTPDRKWKVRRGTVFGCRLDLNRGRIRFYRDSRELGVAFTGVTLRGGALHPVVSVSPGARIRLHFQPHKFRSRPHCWGAFYYPICGDNPKLELATNANTETLLHARAFAALMKRSRCVIMAQGPPEVCRQFAAQVARRAAPRGRASVTSAPRSACKAFALGRDPVSSGGAATAPRRVVWAGARQAVASEVIALCRFLARGVGAKNGAKSAGRNAGEWAAAMRSAVVKPIKSTSYSLGSCSPAEFSALLGALAIAGGFNEDLRVGGTVMVRRRGAPGPARSVVESIVCGPNGDTLVHLSNADPQTTSVPAKSVTPVPDTRLSIAEIPLDAQLYAALHSLVLADTKANGGSGGDWRTAEALWRAVAVFDHLLSPVGSASRLDPAVAGSLRTLLLSLARESQLHRRLATEAQFYKGSRRAIWQEQNPRLVGALAPRPVRAARAVTNAPAASSKRALKWVYSANPLEQYRDGAAGLGQAAAESNGSATANVGSQEPRARARLLAHWESRIIPAIERLVRPSFQEYQMADFFAQIRSPLRQGEPNRAVGVVFTLCDGKCPDGVEFPGPKRDWLRLEAADLSVGDAVCITDAVRALGPSHHSVMLGRSVGMTGRVRAVAPLPQVRDGGHPRAEHALALVQVVDVDTAVAWDVWVPVHCLRMAASGAPPPPCAMPDPGDPRRLSMALTRRCRTLAHLLARRAVFGIYGSGGAVDSSQAMAASSSDAAAAVQVLADAASEALDFGSLSALGSPLPTHTARLKALERRLSDAVDAFGGNPHSKPLYAAIQSRFEAAASTLAFVQTVSVGTRGAEAAEAPIVTRLSAPDAALLSIEFPTARVAPVPQGASLGIYEDRDLVRLRRDLQGAGAARWPLVVSSGEAFAAWRGGGDKTVDFPIRVTPIPASLGVALWLVQYALRRDRVGSPDAGARIRMRLLDMYTRTFDLKTMAASPVKERLLEAASLLLAGGRMAQGVNLDDDTAASAALGRLRVLHDEMRRLYSGESPPAMSAYYQKLARVCVLADALRPQKDRVLPRPRLAPPPTTPRATAARANAKKRSPKGAWACAVCTFENKAHARSCEVCGAPKQAAQATTRPEASGPAKSSNSTETPRHATADDLYNDLVLLSEIMSAFGGGGAVGGAAASGASATPSADPMLLAAQPSSVLTSVLQSCWNECAAPDLVGRFVLVRNLPHVVSVHEDVLVSDQQNHKFVAAQIVRKAVGSDVAVVHPDIHVGALRRWDSANPKRLIKEAKRTTPRRLDAPPDADTATVDGPDLPHGVIWHLGTRGGDRGYENPAAGLHPAVQISINPPANSQGPGAAQSLLDPRSTDNAQITVRSAPRPNASLRINLLDGKVLVPSGYALVVPSRARPRSWRFEASHNGSTWTLLHAANRSDVRFGGPVGGGGDGKSPGQRGDRASSVCVGLHRVGVGSSGEKFRRGYSHFRITTTAPASNGAWGLALVGIELYGVLGGSALRSPPRPSQSGRYAVLQLTSAEPQRIRACLNRLDGRRVDGIQIEAGGVCAPRMVKLRAMRLADADAKARDAIMRQLRRDLLFRGEDTPTPRLERALREAFIACCGGDGALVRDGAPPSPGKVRGRLDIERARRVVVGLGCASSLTAGMKYREFRRTVCSEPADGLWSWLRGLGFDINLSRHRLSSLEDAIAALRRLPRSRARAAIAYYEKIAAHTGQSSVLDMDPSALIEHGAPACELVKNIPMTTTRLFFALLKRINRVVMSAYPLLSGGGPRVLQLLRPAREFIFSGVKQELIRGALDFTSCAEAAGGPLTVTVDRVSAALLGAGEYNFETHSLFAGAMRQLAGAAAERLRVPRPPGAEPHLGFRIRTQNERVVGEGGPYRQFFTDVSDELQSPESPLLVATPNQRARVGEHRDKFMFRPATGPGVQAMLRFLGRLFGVCLRTGVRMPLRFPPLVWKAMAGERLARGDLRGVDHATAEVLGLFETVDEKTFAQMFASESQSFTVRMGDGSVRELTPGGARAAVGWRDRARYVAMAERARLCEQDAQVAAVREAMGAVVPLQLLGLLTWSDLELRLCGRPRVDVDMLQRHTQYSGVRPDAPHVRTFWRLLRTLPQRDLRALIRFCWGQDRLPATDKEFEASHTRFLIKASLARNPDRALPRADTCFFNLELPAYSSQRIMREKLLFAINTVTTMDADQVVDDE